MDERRINKARRLLNEEIVRCYNCQPYDKGNPFWLGPPKYVYEVLEEYEYSDEQWKEILRDVKCPNCGTELTEMYDEVEVKSEIDREIEKVFDKISDKRRVNSLKKFNDYLSKYPYLGGINSLGRKIIKSIKQGVKYSINDEVWYRARLINNDSRMFKSEEMTAPDPSKIFIKEGRYNHTGQSFLYLANYEATSFNEIAISDDNVCIMQKFNISSIDNILDLRRDYDKVDLDTDILFLAIIYNGYVSQRPNKSISWKPEYFVTRYIADVARNLGYAGIIYSSAHYGDNLVIFDRNNSAISPFEKTYLFTKPETSEYEFPDIEI